MRIKPIVSNMTVFLYQVAKHERTHIGAEFDTAFVEIPTSEVDVTCSVIDFEDINEHDKSM